MLVTTTLLILGEMLGKRTRKLETVTWFDAFIIGCFQILSLFPGVSRSGSTISGGLIRQFNRESAARFSFLMSIPIMLAAGVFEISNLSAIPDLSSFLAPLIIGTIFAGLVGFFSIKWLLGYLKNHSLFSFSLYCIGVWLATFVVTLIRG
jgi:undecaprenyl-diphosphatase